MVIKKVPPRAVVVLSHEEHHRVVQVVALLAAVARRVGARSAEVRCISANKRKSSKEKGTGLKHKKENKVRKFYGPCFLFQTLYSETGNCKLKNPLKWFAARPAVPAIAESDGWELVEGTTSGFYIQRDSHDRYHSFNIH